MIRPSNLLFALSRQLLNLTLASVFAIVSARLLGPYERGLLVTVLVISQIGGQFGTLGINQTVRVLAPRFSLGEIVNSLKRYPLPVGVIASVLVIPFVLLAVPTLGSIETVMLVVVTAANAVMTAWCVIRRDLLHGRGLHTEAQNGELLQWAVATFLLMTLLLLPTGELKLASGVAALLSGSAAQLVYLHARLHRVSRNDVEVDSASGPVVLTLQLRAFVGSSGQYAMMRVDKLLIAIVFGPTLVAHYSIASTLTELSWVACLLFSQYASRWTILGDLRGVRTIRRLNLVVVAVWSTIAIIVAPSVIPFIFGPDYADSLSLVAPRAVGAGACGVFYLELSVLVACGKLRLSAIISWISVSLTIGCVAIGSQFLALDNVLWLCALSILICALCSRLTSGLEGRRA